MEVWEEGSVGKSRVPETDGEGCRENPPYIMKTPQSTKLQLWVAPSVLPTATERQQPANKHPLMNGKKSLIQRRLQQYGLILGAWRGSYVLICITKRSRWVPVWSADWMDSETDHQWRVGNGGSGFLEISLAALVELRQGRGRQWGGESRRQSCRRMKKITWWGKIKGLARRKR